MKLYNVKFESNLGRREAWVLAESAEHARALIRSAHVVATFEAVQQYTAPRIICYVG